jgi:hypothetical protein
MNNDDQILRNIYFEVGEIKGQLTQLVAQMGTRDKRDNEDKAKTDVRLSKVEARQYWLAGVGSALSAAATYWIKGKSV